MKWAGVILTGCVVAVGLSIAYIFNASLSGLSSKQEWWEVDPRAAIAFPLIVVLSVLVVVTLDWANRNKP